MKCLAALQQSEGDGHLDKPHRWITRYDNVDEKMFTMPITHVRTHTQTATHPVNTQGPLGLNSCGLVRAAPLALLLSLR